MKCEVCKDENKRPIFSRKGITLGGNERRFCLCESCLRKFETCHSIAIDSEEYYIKCTVAGFNTHAREFSGT